jgi:chitinase
VSLQGKNLANMAENVVNFLNYFDLDGIDFDLEKATDRNQLANLLTIIKAKTLKSGKNPIITAAPQINTLSSQCKTWDNNPKCRYEVGLVTTKQSDDYTVAIQKGLFDYLLLQGYNTDGSTNRIEFEHQYCNGIDSEMQKKYCDETMPGYISSVYKYLLKQTVAKQSYVNIPANTKIIVGEPAIAAAAGSGTVFHGSFKYQNLYTLMSDVYKELKNDAQFGGAMSWSANHDIEAQCQFAHTVGKSLTGTTSTYCQATGK